jgi:RNA polymerase sigma-70 factor (ECF subfamily)
MSSQKDPIRAKDDERRWRALMTSAQAGDGVAYAELLSDLFPVLHRFVRRKSQNRQDVEDIVQEILVSLHTVRHTYDPRRPFTPWLMMIAARRVADAARRRYARGENEIAVDVLPETFQGDETKFEQEASLVVEDIRRALAVLPESQREAIELIKIRGLSLEEAAEATGKSIGSLKVRVHRAIKAMRQALEQKSRPR